MMADGENGDKLQQFLREVSPLGAPLTESQSAQYRDLLIGNGVTLTGVGGLLEALKEIDPIVVSSQEPKP